MRPRAASNEPNPEEESTLPRFWRVQYADLVALWGEAAAKHMLRAMERAYLNQEPAPTPEKPYPKPDLRV